MPCVSIIILLEESIHVIAILNIAGNNNVYIMSPTSITLKTDTIFMNKTIFDQEDMTFRAVAGIEQCCIS